MRRREFVAGLLGAAAYPIAARAQQSERMRRIGVLLTGAEDDREFQTRISVFLQQLQQLGWGEGRNIRIETRWGMGDADRIRRNASELAALTPEVILAVGAPSVSSLLQVTRAVPIVFANVIDPIGAGFVDNLSHPGGNITGFTNFEFGISVKWLELLREIAPRITRVAVLRDAAIAAGSGQFGAIQAVAPSFGVELRPVDLRDAAEIERAVDTFARSSNGALIVTGSGLSVVHRGLIATLAAKHKLPTVYWNRTPVADGGLISYGPDLIDQYRRAAGYVDRILKGEKPADLPVQPPTKYELVVNRKTAIALGLTIPPSLLARADEVIE